MEAPKRKTTTFLFETLPSYKDPNRGGPSPDSVRPGHPDPSKDGAIKEFEWKGYLSPENKFTLEKLKVLDPRRHPAGVMAERAKLQERTTVFVEAHEKIVEGRKVKVLGDQTYARHGENGLVRYEKGEFLRSEDGELIKKEDGVAIVVKEYPQESAPVHEFIAGRKYVTPKFVKSRKEAVGEATEPLRPETVDAFAVAIESHAKKSGQKLGDTYYSTFDLGDDQGATLAFTWVDQADRAYDALTERIDMGTFSVITQNNGMPETVQYSIFEDENGLAMHRHAWLTDPNFQSDYMSPPTVIKDLSEAKIKQYDQFLAGQIENLYRMNQEVERGYAAVDEIEANEGLSFLARAMN